MSTLSNAPLNEAIFTLCWGKQIKQAANQLQFQFSKEEQDFFPGLFSKEMREAGYAHSEKLREEPILIPLTVTYRFRRAPNSWPCYQIGVGIFTVNQLNDGYNWPTFSKDIKDGLNRLDESHPSKLKGLPPIEIALHYQDILYFKEGEKPIDFLKNKLEIGFDVPKALINFEQFDDTTTKPESISFSVRSIKPKGYLLINLNPALVNQKPCFNMVFIVKTSDTDLPQTLSHDYLTEWLEDAHKIQKHAFSTIIKPELQKELE
ncbi:MAG: TIGR04255 family protein [Chlorobiales bacterium]|nr:TIGR04255 family protein [Chlorobiales bacterium]